jgi:hypothetical protein
MHDDSKPKRGGRTATHKAKQAQSDEKMGKMMHRKVAKTVQMKEQRNRTAKKH